MSTSNALPAVADLEARSTTPEALAPWEGVSLRHAALQCLLEPDAMKKAELSFAIAAAWRQGLLPLDEDASGSSTLPAVPDSPGRPDSVKMIPPAKMKAARSRKALIHALVHAESFAIDLGWDMIARFGFTPSLWAVAQEHREEAMASSSSSSSSPPTPTTPSSLLEPLPRAFFDDWVRLAVEEARHFSRWRVRLAELGAKYGDIPAHAGLWESASDTSHSLAARLAIVHCVHEARGLDVAPLMRGKLTGGGEDAGSPAILDANVQDEITHVGTGVRWLRWVAAREGVEAAPLFHALVRAHFRGPLRPPFNDAFRQKADMTPDWYLPLAAAPAPGAEEKEQELSPEDMG
jgi:uncharacterized ferritin-like protein (DUF455 family)